MFKQENHNLRRDKSMALRYIDLFAGLGGFHLAMRRLGHRCVFASELKDDLRKLYKINFPTTQIFGDITEIPVEQIPPHDILCAGFPCQPFSQAGKQQGFHDEKNRGNLFDNICAIIEFRRPRYILLENVSNLLGHDEGRTWATIRQRLDDLDYEVPEPAILSPHEFGIPQHRKRIYIVAADRRRGGVGDFTFPERQRVATDIRSIIDENETHYVKIKADTRHQMEVWQEFINQCIAHDQPIPRFPIWAMEFGATYDYRTAPAFQSARTLRQSLGKLGQPITGRTVAECLEQIPVYSQTAKEVTFPKWKISYIRQNREFYERNRAWLDEWIETVRDFENSHLKMEWNCGVNATPTLDDKIIQFRASGIRVKLPNFSPALNLVGTQVPILPWIQLPPNTIEPGEPDRGRYMTVKEAARLQGMGDLKFKNRTFALAQSRCYEALGNAVNVDIVQLIAERLLPAHE